MGPNLTSALNIQPDHGNLKFVLQIHYLYVISEGDQPIPKSGCKRASECAYAIPVSRVSRFLDCLQSFELLEHSSQQFLVFSQFVRGR